MISGNQHGATLIELVICAPVLLLLGLGTVQMGLLYHAKTTLNYATFEAARKGAVTHAQQATMKEELGVRLAPLFGGTGKTDAAAKAIASASLDVIDPRFTQLVIVSPSQQAFKDWAVYNPLSGSLEIPNSHLRQRNTERVARPLSGVGLQGANLLKISVTYGYKMTVPVVGKLLAQILLRLNSSHAGFYAENRLPIRAHATLRMQSPARPDNNLSVTTGETVFNTPAVAVTPAFVPVVGVLCDANGLRSDIDSDALDVLLNDDALEDNCVGDTTVGSLVSTSLANTTGSSVLGTAEQSQGLTDCIP